MTAASFILDAIHKERAITASRIENKRTKIREMRHIAKRCDDRICGHYKACGCDEQTAKYFGLEPQTVRDVLQRRGYIPRARLTSKA